MAAKDMLKTLLTQGTLTAKDREIFESMWDQAHRSKLSYKQIHWVETEFYKQKLDRPVGREPPKRSPATLILKGDVPHTLRANSVEKALTLLPGLTLEHPLGVRLKEFFASGGEVVEIHPKTSEAKP